MKKVIKKVVVVKKVAPAIKRSDVKMRPGKTYKQSKAITSKMKKMAM